MTHSQSFDAIATALFVVQRAQGFASDMESNKWKLYRSKNIVRTSIEMCTHIHQVVMCGVVWFGMKKGASSENVGKKK